MSQFKQKIFASAVFISLLGFVFLSPVAVKKADAGIVPGVPDPTFTLMDIPRAIYQIGVKIAGVYLRQLKTKMLKQIQNDLVNWVQGGGKPRFLTNPESFLKTNAENAAATAIDNYFSENTKIDICSPFKANLKLLVQRAVYLPEAEARCSLGDIKKNLVGFKDSFTKGGGWTTWIALHETRNTLPGSYLAAIETIGSKITKSGNSATMEISAGKGFLNQKNCKVAEVRGGACSCTGVGPTKTFDDPDCGLFNASNQFGASDFSADKETTTAIDYFGNTITRVCTGVTVPELYNPSVRMDQLPPNSRCIEEETITPGSIIGDQISGGLSSLGVGKLVNARELGEILDAVIDAAVNRVAREGLSKVKTKRGSWTTPQAGSKSDKDRSQSETEIQGLEGFKASQLLISALEFKTSTEKLVRTMKNLGGDSPVKIQKFTESLDGIRDYSHLRTCGKSAVGTQQKIQKCFYNLAENLDESYGVDLNIEENNPSVYKANQSLLEKTAEVWTTIETKLTELQGKSMADCNDISITLNPDDNQLPIFFAGNDDNQTEKFYDWTGRTDNYTHYFEDMPNTDVTKKVAVMAGIASGQIQTKNSAARAYETRAESVAETINSIDDDTSFIDMALAGITLYTKVMMDYDKSGRYIILSGGEETSLVAEIQKYNSAMESKDEASVVSARRRLMDARSITEADWLASSTGKTTFPIIDFAKKSIDDSRFMPDSVFLEDEKGAITLTDIDKVSVGQTIIVPRGATIPVDGFVVEGNSGVNKSRVTGETDDLEIVSARLRSKVYAGSINLAVEKHVGKGTETIIYPSAKIKVQITGFVDGSLQTGTGPSKAVGKALELVLNKATEKPYLPFGIEQIENELEIRGTRISKLQNETTSKIGRFLTDNSEMAMAGLDGGDTEWEKYYYNRAQYAYAAIILHYITGDTTDDTTDNGGRNDGGTAIKGTVIKNDGGKALWGKCSVK